jgi:hypothetical protein
MSAAGLPQGAKSSPMRRQPTTRSPLAPPFRHALAHSLRVRLVALFLLLALAMAATFLIGMQKAFSHRLARRGPPAGGGLRGPAGRRDRQPAQHRTRPGHGAAPARGVRISGPQVNWRSHPASRIRSAAGPSFANPLMPTPQNATMPRAAERTTADGHRIRFGLNVQVWQDRPAHHWLGHAGRAAAADRRWPMRACAACCARWTTSAPARSALARATLPSPSPCAMPHPDELGELAATINTMGADIHQMLDAKRACCWPSATSCAAR